MRIVKKSFFKPVAPEVRKDVSILLRMSKVEADELRQSAKVRNLSVSEFLRRAAQGRRAEADFETQIVLRLSNVIHAIRMFHKDALALKLMPPEELWTPLIDEAINAMRTIKDV